jgi:hypothetical protein
MFLVVGFDSSSLSRLVDLVGDEKDGSYEGIQIEPLDKAYQEKESDSDRKNIQNGQDGKEF